MRAHREGGGGTLALTAVRSLLAHGADIRLVGAAGVSLTVTGNRASTFIVHMFDPLSAKTYELRATREEVAVRVATSRAPEAAVVRLRVLLLLRDTAQRLVCRARVCARILPFLLLEV